MTANLLLAFAHWLAEAPDEWPAEAVEAAHRAFIDIVAVGIRGAAEESAQRVFAAIAGWGSGPSTAIGMGAGLSVPWAALVNGTSAHALDFDDNFDPGKAHATAVLVPGILALGEQEGASGRACVDAYIAGLQILGRVGEGLNPVHRSRGWHATATVGAVGAAAACARLLQLDGERCANALSIATSMASGFMSQFGTTTKPMHAGLAARAGVMAASLARSGIDAGRGTLEGRTGMTRLMVGPDYEALQEAFRSDGQPDLLRFETDRVGEPLLILSHGLRAKRFPNCGSAHRSMDALLELKSRHGFTAGEVREVRVRAPRNHLNNLMYDAPENAPQAKFSLEYALAVLLVDGECRLSHFTEEAVMRPDIRAACSNIIREPIDNREGDATNHVEVVLADGRSLTALVAHAVGSRARPFALEDYWAKFDTCTDLLAPNRAAELREALQALPELETLASLMQPLAGRVEAS